MTVADSRQQRMVAALLAILASACAHAHAKSTQNQQVEFVRTRGVSVTVDVVPLSSLSGEDVWGQQRAKAFLSEVRASFAKGLSGVAFHQGFGRMAVEVELEREALFDRAHTSRVRVVESVPQLDRQLLVAASLAGTVPLPNFRGRCLLEIYIREAAR